jgi:hypothetical protein
VVEGKLGGFPRYLDLAKPNDPPLGLRDDLLGHDDDVTVHELDAVGDLSAQVVAFDDLRHAQHRKDPDLSAHFGMTPSRTGALSGAWQGRRERSYPEGTGATEDDVHASFSAAGRLKASF